ncbi:MAG: hypothetical protein ACK5NB_06590 [Flavobacteriaceae bacterium]
MKTKQKTNKAKLAFKMLEKEFETLNKTELQSFSGGNGPTGHSGVTGYQDPGTDCVFQTMSYISNQLGCGHYTNFYDSLYGAGSSGNGVGTNLGEFILHNFSMSYTDTSASGMQNAINNGNEVFLVIRTDSGTLHAVAFDSSTDGVTGIDGSTCIQVWDEQMGECYSIDQSDIVYGTVLN